MPNTTTSTNMNLVLPVPLVDPGPDWAQRLYTALNVTVDAHDHSSGKGVQITPPGLNVNADLPFGSNNATLLRSSRYVQQSAALALGPDVGCLSNVLGDAYWNNASGTPIQLTKNGAVNAITLVFPLHPGTAGGTILATDPYSLYYLDVSSAPATLNLPAATGLTPGRLYYVSDIKGASATHNISIVPNGTDKINGVNTTYVINSNGASAVLTTDGAGNWTANAIVSGTITGFGADLLGSTFSNQWVASISGSGGGGSAVPVNALGLSFGATQANPAIVQTTQTSDVAANTLFVSAQSAFATAATNVNGGALTLRGGGSKTPGTTGLRGPVRIQPGQSASSILLEASEPVVGQFVLSLLNGAAVSSTNMPAGSGNKVAYLAQAGTVPTVAPTSGLTLYSNAGSPGSLGLLATGLAPNSISGNFAIQADTPTTGVAGSSMSLFGQNGGTGVQNGGDLVLGGGTRTSTGVDGIVRMRSRGVSSVRSLSTTFALDSSGADLDIEVDTTGGSFTVTLPTPSAGRYLRITDKLGQLGTNPLTLAQHASELINNIAASRTLSAAWGVYEVWSDGTNWWVRGMNARASKVFTANGSWVAPSGVPFVDFEMVGGGGGGGGGVAGDTLGATNPSCGGGGGGAGSFAKGTLPVTPNTSYTTSVGGAGTAGSAGSSGGVGGASQILNGATVVASAPAGSGGTQGVIGTANGSVAFGGPPTTWNGANATQNANSTIAGGPLTTSLSFITAGSAPGTGGSTLVSGGNGTAFASRGFDMVPNFGNPFAAGGAGGAQGTTSTGAGGGGGGGGGGGAYGGGGAGATGGAGSAAAGGAPASAGTSAAANTGAGGGGGGSGGNGTSGGAGGAGGAGGSGKITLYWWD